MDPVERHEIMSLEDYEIARPAVRKRIMEIKAARRVAVGDHITILFENHDTVLYQIQEMLRAERITDPEAIQYEIDTYNELVPGENELTATLLIEYEDPAERDRRLRELVGLERHVRIEVAGEVCPAHFDERQTSPERISSVHYVSFPLTPRAAYAICQGERPTIVIDHPQMKARATLDERQTRALAEDLSS